MVGSSVGLTAQRPNVARAVRESIELDAHRSGLCEPQVREWRALAAVQVAAGFDQADDYIAEQVQPGDLVIMVDDIVPSFIRNSG